MSMALNKLSGKLESPEPVKMSRRGQAARTSRSPEKKSTEIINTQPTGQKQVAPKVDKKEDTKQEEAKEIQKESEPLESQSDKVESKAIVEESKTQDEPIIKEETTNDQEIIDDIIKVAAEVNKPQDTEPNMNEATGSHVALNDVTSVVEGFIDSLSDLTSPERQAITGKMATMFTMMKNNKSNNVLKINLENKMWVKIVEY